MLNSVHLYKVNKRAVNFSLLVMNISKRDKKMYAYFLKKEYDDLAVTLQILLLQDDFQELIEDLTTRFVKKDGYFNLDYTVNGKSKIHKDTPSIVSHYINDLLESNYVKNTKAKTRRAVKKYSYKIIWYAYLESYAHSKPYSAYIKKIRQDDISHIFVRGEITSKPYSSFTKGAVATYHFQKRIRGLDKPILSFAHNAKKSTRQIEKDSGKISNKVCVVAFEEDADKEDVTQYIKDNWESIRQDFTRESKPKSEKMIASETFLRDVEIYEKYREYKADKTNKTKNIYGDLHIHLENMTDFEAENLEISTIKAAVSNIKKLEDMVNK